MKKIAFAIAAAAALGLGGLAACQQVQETTGIEFVNPYEGVTGFQNSAFVTIRLYEATLDSAIFACDVAVNPDAGKTPDAVCEKAAQAAEALSPRVEATSRLLGTYSYLDAKVNAILADGEVVPPEVLGAAAEAFYKAQTEWADIEGDINAFLGKK